MSEQPARPKPHPQSAVLVEFCLDCKHIAQIKFVAPNSSQIEVIHVWNEGMGGLAHVSNVPPPDPHCDGRWGLATAFVLDDDEPSGDFDIVVPGTGRFYRKNGEMKVWEG